MKRKYIIFIGFVCIMLFLLTRMDVKELIRDLVNQAWIFGAMLLLKFGEENIWKPFIKGKALEEASKEKDKEIGDGTV